MKLRTLFEAHPLVRESRDKQCFAATVSVTLQHWQDLDRATSFCERRWREYRLHYRRRVRADESQAYFEFDDDDYAIEFLMRFGSRCRALKPSP